jgi:hypothetical protein
VNAQIERLPGCDYFHVVFTVPDELNGLWSYNRERFTKLLLRAGWETLRQMLGDPKHLGALPGALAGFHSWGQTLWVHPHAHFLVTAGGLDDQGAWRPCRYQGLLPARAVSAKFRGKLRAWLIRDLQRGALRAPPDRPAHRWEHELNRLGRKRWHVHIQPRYRHGRGVVRYLGRYLKGGCVSDRRLSRGADGQVELSYKDNRCHPPKRMRLRLSEEELMGRVLAHVPETGQHVVRSYGLFASSKRGELAGVRQRCGGLPGPESGPGSGEQPRPEEPDVVRLPEPERCPVCGRPLLVYTLPRRSRAPP